MSDYRSFFGRGTARDVAGGIKAQTSSGAFGKNWWARKWISTLESFDIGTRLSRGRAYARRGQVISIDIAEGLVRAAVQGSRREPYQVEIAVKTIDDEQWKRLFETAFTNVGIAANLINGEMPQNIDEAFQQNGLSLFPEKSNDLNTKCSCPDYSNPCKHIAAVYYLLGEEFDRDPFLLFRLRGMSKEKLLSLLIGSVSPAEPSPRPAKRKPKTDRSTAKTLPPADRFWQSKSIPPAINAVRPPTINAHIPKVLGSPPFWRANTNFLQAMDRIYRHASSHAVELLTVEGDAVRRR
jgi:uncharacterized Zn finger protein